MKISEVIAHLNALKEKHGDLDIIRGEADSFTGEYFYYNIDKEGIFFQEKIKKNRLDKFNLPAIVMI